MCGIFCYIGKNKTKDDLKDNFERIMGRGPDNNILLNIDNVLIGFHRLSINDLSV